MLIRDVTDRRRAEQALRDSETRLRIQSRRMPISLFTWRAEGDDLVLVAYNPAAEEQSAGRVKRWLGARASELTGERADVAADLLTCLRERRTIHRQVEYAPGDGNAPRHLDVHYAFVPPDCVQVYAIDVTDRVRTNRELERERRFSEHILETAPYAIYVYDPHHGETIYANNQFEQVLGYSLAELRQTGTAEWVRRNVHMEDQSVFEDYFGRMLTQPDGKIVEREGRVRQPDGSIKWVRSREVVLGRNQDGQVTQVLGTAWDVTDAKNRERQIVAYQDRLRSLASELGFAEERERRRIAAGLHDRVSQNLVLSQIRLKMLHDACGDPDQRRTLEEVMDVLARTETDTRELTFEICPPVLYELGFGPALEWLAEQHERRYGLAIEVRADGDLGEIDPDLAGLLFQVARELLQNAADHARARRVSLAARRHAGKLELRVTDDGIGFDPERRPPAGHGGRGFGLFGVQERLRHEGGSLEIDSAPGRGTRVTAIVPIQ
jgi:PAS domain S-box-containing protein